MFMTDINIYDISIIISCAFLYKNIYLKEVIQLSVCDNDIFLEYDDILINKRSTFSDRFFGSNPKKNMKTEMYKLQKLT